jgi:hypothetical protein
VFDVPARAVEHRGEFSARALPDPPALLGYQKPKEHLGFFFEAGDRQYLPCASDGEYVQPCGALSSYQPERSACKSTFQRLPFPSPRHEPLPVNILFAGLVVCIHLDAFRRKAEHATRFSGSTSSPASSNTLFGALMLGAAAHATQETNPATALVAHGAHLRGVTSRLP